MKVDRLTFASTVGYLSPSGLTIMWMFFILTYFFYTKHDWVATPLCGSATSAFAYLMWKSYFRLPKEVEIIHIQFGGYEEMSDFGSCYNVPSCWVTFKMKNGLPHETRIEKPKGRIRKELVKWRNTLCKSEG